MQDQQFYTHRSVFAPSVAARGRATCRAGRRTVLVSALALLAFAALSAASAEGAMLVALTGGGGVPNRLYDVDRVTGAFSNERTISDGTLVGLRPLIDVEFDDAGLLYGVSVFSLTQPANSLYRIDPATGNATLIGATGLTEITEGDLAYDPTTDVLYGTSNGITGHRDLFTINRATGAATVVGSIALTGDMSGMAIDQRTGDLYVINTSTTSSLLKVDKTNGAVLSSIALTTTFFGQAGFDYDPVLDKFLVARGGGSASRQTLFEIDLATGAMTQIGLTGGLFTQGLATYGPIVPIEVPEPASAGLLALGLMGTCVVRRRERSGNP